MGFTVNLAQNACVPCDIENCTRCEEENTCSQCDEGLEIVDNECV